MTFYESLYYNFFMSIFLNTLIIINSITIIKNLFEQRFKILKFLCLLFYNNQQIIVITIMKISDESMLELDFHDNSLQKIFFVSLTEILFIKNVINIILIILYNLHKQLSHLISEILIQCIWIQMHIFMHHLLMINCHSIYDYFEIIIILDVTCKLIWQHKVIIVIQLL